MQLIFEFRPALYFFALCVMVSWETGWARPQPRREIWTSPCSSGPTRTGKPYVSFVYPEAEKSQLVTKRSEAELPVVLREAQREARKLERKLKKGLRNKVLKRDCKRRSLRGMPQLKSDSVEDSGLDAFEVIPDDYRRIAIASIFLDAAKHDTPLREKEFQSLLSKLRVLMCHMEQIALGHGQRLVTNFTTAIMPTYYKNMREESRRDRRNCVIVRALHKLLRDIAKWHTN